MSSSQIETFRDPVSDIEYEIELIVYASGEVKFIRIKEVAKPGEIVLRDIPREQAKEEIRELFTTGGTLYYSDITERLGLDLELVVDICQELLEAGEITDDDPKGGHQ